MLFGSWLGSSRNHIQSMHADRVSKREIERFCCQKETHFVNVNVDTVTSIGESAPSHPGRHFGSAKALLYEK